MANQSRLILHVNILLSHHTVFDFYEDFHFVCIIVVIAALYFFCSASAGALEAITSLDPNDYLSPEDET